jgi:hypothetical protein
MYGWRVRADTTLEPLAVADSAAEPDLIVSARGVGPVAAGRPVGTVLAEFPHCETCTKTYWLVADDAGFLLRFPGEVEYRIGHDMKHVNWRRSPGVSLGHARELFRGHAMALLLGLAGFAVFHSSGVLLPDPSRRGSGRAVAFMGGAGAGKSTFAALSVAAGATFLTDDLLCVVPAGDGVWVRGGCAELRLRRTASKVAELFDGVPSRTTLDNRLALTLGAGGLAHERLGLLVFPELSNEAKQVTVSPLRPKEAAVRLAGSPRMAGWLLRRVLEVQLSSLARIANEVPAVRFQLPWSDTSGAEHAEALVRQVEEAMWSYGLPA